VIGAIVGHKTVNEIASAYEIHPSQVGKWKAEALYPKRRLSVPGGPEHRIHPYLLRGLRIDHPNQVWSVDMTYVRLSPGFVYLMAVLDYRTPWEVHVGLGGDGWPPGTTGPWPRREEQIPQPLSFVVGDSGQGGPILHNEIAKRPFLEVGDQPYGSRLCLAP
jgi:hypothetical protein